MTREELCRAAREMLERAYVPYSHFPVGAALESADGAVFTGCNVENASYPAGICAERAAVCRAVSEGRRSFRRIAVAADSDRFCPPCGVCRQVLAEFSPDLEVLLVNRAGEIRSLSLRELLPLSFGAENLEARQP